MRISEIKKQLLTIPNIITFFRMLCIPFIIFTTVSRRTWINWGEYQFPIIGLILLIIAAVSDVFDGMLARKFNQETAIGAALDPISDKLMHISALISLVSVSCVLGQGYKPFVHYGFLIALFIKELLMIAGGLFLVRYSQPIKANYMGKVASALLSLGIILSFFHPFFMDETIWGKVYFDWLIILLALILTYVAFFIYLRQAFPVFKTIIKCKKAGIDPNTYFEEKAKADSITEDIKQ